MKQLNEPICVDQGWFWCNRTNYTENASIHLDDISVKVYKRFVTINLDTREEIRELDMLNISCKVCEVGKAVTLSAITSVDLNGIKYVFNGFYEESNLISDGTLISFNAERSQNIFASYHKQFYLNVVSDYGKTYGSGWWTADSIATFSVTSPVDVAEGVQYMAQGFFGDALGSFHKGTVKMDGPKQIRFQWLTQFLVEFPKGSDQETRPN